MVRTINNEEAFGSSLLCCLRIYSTAPDSVHSTWLAATRHDHITIWRIMKSRTSLYMPNCLPLEWRVKRPDTTWSLGIEVDSPSAPRHILRGRDCERSAPVCVVLSQKHSMLFSEYTSGGSGPMARRERHFMADF